MLAHGIFTGGVLLDFTWPVVIVVLLVSAAAFVAVTSKYPPRE